jgi:hypothetical protein
MAALIIFCALLTGSEAVAASWFVKPKYIFRKGQDTWVKVVKGNKKLAPFSHPYEFSVEDMEAALGSIRYLKPDLLSMSGKKGKEYDALSAEEIKLLAEPLAKAFKEAGPEEWVDFSVNTFRGQIIIGSFRQSDGVMFVQDGKLNVALRNIAVKTAPDQQVNTYDPTKSYRAPTKLVAVAGQELKSENWIIMDAKNIPRIQAAGTEGPMIVIPTQPAPAPAATPAPAPTPAPAAPGTEDLPAPTTEAAPPAAPAPPAQSVKDRLLQLQELYDQGLISKEEYEKKRQEILKDL